MGRQIGILRSALIVFYELATGNLAERISLDLAHG